MSPLSSLFVSERQVVDVVHGSIPLQPHETRVINHPLFQRLRHITQNDVLTLVFPGANHSRFAHSIGAMHVAGRMWHAMISNRLREHPEHMDATALQGLGYLGNCLRLAVLLHDVGHGPFSHQLECAPSIHALMASPDAFGRLWQDLPWEVVYRERPAALAHEHYSVWVAWHILSELGMRLPCDPRDVLSLMETTRCTPSEQFTRAARQAWTLLTGEPWMVEAPALVQALLKTLVSSEVDADKADYLLRDTYHCGTRVGHYDLEALLAGMDIAFLDGALVPVLQAKTRPTLEGMLYARYQMYRQVYGHRVAVGFDWLLQASVDEQMQQADVADAVQNALFQAQAFTYFTDDFFWAAFRRHAYQHPDSMAARLVHRRRLRSLEILPPGEPAPSPLEPGVVVQSMHIHYGLRPHGQASWRVRRGRQDERLDGIADIGSHYPQGRWQYLFHLQG